MPILKDKKKRSDLRHLFFEELKLTGVPLAEAVKTLRKILAQDQATFAKQMKISLSALRRIEQGQKNVTLNTINKILRNFDLEVVVRSKRT